MSTPLRRGSYHANAVVYKDGSTYYYHNKDTGVQVSGSSAATIINGAIESLTAARSWVERVYCAGDFTLSTYVQPKSYTHLMVDGRWTLANSANTQLIYGVKTDPALSYFTLEGGIFDGNAANQTSSTPTRSGTITVAATNLDHVFVKGASVLNSFRHGIFMEDNTSAGYYYKEISNCRVYNVGVGATAYGIYPDFVDNCHILDNYVENVAATDGIELGNARYVCRGNILVDTPINFPFASNSIIEGNILSGTRGNIQNDANTANYVIIRNNQILGASPATGYAGISCYGDYNIVEGNYVKVVGEAGIYNKSGSAANMFNIIRGNVVESTRVSVTGSEPAIRCNRGKNVIEGNTVKGKWKYGVQVSWDNDIINENVIESDVDTGVFLTTFAISGRDIQFTTIEDNQIMTTTTPIGGNLEYALIRANYGYNPKGNLSTPFKTATTTIGVGGNTATITASTDYTIRGTDLMITSTGGTGVSITIKDGAGSTQASGLTTLTAQYLPLGFKINFGAFSVAPTVTVTAM